MRDDGTLPTGDRVGSVFGCWADDSPLGVFPAVVGVYFVGILEEIPGPHHDDIFRSCCYPAVTLTPFIHCEARFCLYGYVQKFMG